jgi:hypothetical protein
VPQIRGLAIDGGVAYEPVTARQLRRELRQRWDSEHPDVAAEQAMLKRLGLLPPDADLRQLSFEVIDAQVAAWYDRASGVLDVVDRDAPLDPAGRVSVAREVDHVAQDRAFDLDGLRVDDPAQADRALARQALIDGDAVGLSRQWAESVLSADELGAASSAFDMSVGLSDLPEIVRRTATFPSIEGWAFVETLLATGGWSAVDAAYERPPASTEQVLHPERYPDDRPVRIELPDLASALGDGWGTSVQRTLGELGIGVWTGDGSAADGWGGDRLVSLEGPDGRWALVWQTA